MRKIVAIVPKGKEPAQLDHDKLDDDEWSEAKVKELLRRRRNLPGSGVKVFDFNDLDAFDRYEPQYLPYRMYGPIRVDEELEKRLAAARKEHERQVQDYLFEYRKRSGSIDEKHCDFPPRETLVVKNAGEFMQAVSKQTTRAFSYTLKLGAVRIRVCRGLTRRLFGRDVLKIVKAYFSDPAQVPASSVTFDLSGCRISGNKQADLLAELIPTPTPVQTARVFTDDHKKVVRAYPLREHVNDDFYIGFPDPPWWYLERLEQRVGWLGAGFPFDRAAFLGDIQYIVACENPETDAYLKSYPNQKERYFELKESLCSVLRETMYTYPVRGLIDRLLKRERIECCTMEEITGFYNLHLKVKQAKELRMHNLEVQRAEEAKLLPEKKGIWQKINDVFYTPLVKEYLEERVYNSRIEVIMRDLFPKGSAQECVMRYSVSELQGIYERTIKAKPQIEAIAIEWQMEKVLEAQREHAAAQAAAQLHRKKTEAWDRICNAFDSTISMIKESCAYRARGDDLKRKTEIFWKRFHWDGHSGSECEMGLREIFTKGRKAEDVSKYSLEELQSIYGAFKENVLKLYKMALFEECLFFRGLIKKHHGFVYRGQPSTSDIDKMFQVGWSSKERSYDSYSVAELEKMKEKLEEIEVRFQKAGHQLLPFIDRGELNSQEKMNWERLIDRFERLQTYKEMVALAKNAKAEVSAPPLTEHLLPQASEPSRNWMDDYWTKRCHAISGAGDQQYGFFNGYYL